MGGLIVVLLIFVLAKAVIAYPTSQRQGAKPVVVFGKVISPKKGSSIRLAINRVGFQRENLLPN